MAGWPLAPSAVKEEESSEEEATAAAACAKQEYEPVPADLGEVHTPEPLEPLKREYQEDSSPETSLPYKWVVEAANLLIPAVGSSLSEALDLIESVCWAQHFSCELAFFSPPLSLHLLIDVGCTALTRLGTLVRSLQSLPYSMEWDEKYS